MIKKINLLSKYIYLISDIHANISLFKKSIESLDLKNDYLFILGDIFEKGNNNIETIDYVMSLIKTKHVYCVVGNCDLVLNQFIGSIDKDKLKYYSLVLKKTILNEFYDSINVDYTKDFDMSLALNKIYIKHKKYFDFINSLPKAIVINDTILLTHANFSESLKKGLLKQDEINELKDYQMKICGHLPVMLFDDSKNIISSSPKRNEGFLHIDCGNNVVPFGGLNLVKLDLTNLSYSFKSFYDYPLVKVNKDVSKKDGLYFTKKEINGYKDECDLISYSYNNDTYYASKDSLSRDLKFVYDSTNIYLGLKKDSLVYLVKKGLVNSLVIYNNLIGLVDNFNLDF